MSISYNKKVIEAVQEHILSFFDSESDFVEQMNHYKKSFARQGIQGAYQIITKLVNGGCFLCYTEDIRHFLIEAFGQTEEEGNKYSAEQVFNRYVHILARDGSSLYEKLLKKFPEETSEQE